MVPDRSLLFASKFNSRGILFQSGGSVPAQTIETIQLLMQMLSFPVCYSDSVPCILLANTSRSVILINALHSAGRVPAVMKGLAWPEITESIIDQ